MKAISITTLLVVSYNTYGLSSCITWDDSKHRAEQISKRLNKYDLVFLQENWCFNDELQKHTDHSYIARGRTTDYFFSSFGCCDCGDGLLTLSNYEIVHQERVVFDQCNGWLGDMHDCWADKGFLYLQLKIGEDLVDVYNVHLDAGDDTGDSLARWNQIKELSMHVEIRKAKKLMIAGDFNISRNKEDRWMIGQGFKDLLRLEEKNTDENSVDHIFHRGLTAGQCDIMGFDNLSDHPAIAVELTEK